MIRALALLLGVVLAGGAWALLAGVLSPAPALPVAATPARTPTETPTPARTPRRSAASKPVACPTGVPRCASVAGRVLYVESVDPDGDGDLHVVLAGGDVTGPGLTAVDIRPGLRPERDPEVGDLVRAAGPVQRGSFGQDQIHALVIRLAR